MYDRLPRRSNRERFDYQHRSAVARRRLSLLVGVLRQKSAEVYRDPQPDCYRFFRLGRRTVAEHLGLCDPTMNRVHKRKKTT